MIKWKKLSDGDFVLTVEANPDWFATVFQYDGRWMFRIGTRGEEQKIYRSKHRWKSSTTAKRKAIRAIGKVLDEKC